MGPSVLPKTFSTRKGSDATWSMCEWVTTIARTLDCSSSVSDSVSAPASKAIVPFIRNEVCRCRGVDPPYAPSTRIRKTGRLSSGRFLPWTRNRRAEGWVFGAPERVEAADVVDGQEENYRSNVPRLRHDRRQDYSSRVMLLLAARPGTNGR